MGIQEDNIKTILKNAGYNITEGILPCPQKDDLLKSEFTDEFQKIYENLGGILESYPLNLGKWDFEVESIAVELDELLHFNRYRLVTLKSKLYKALPAFPMEEYREYCRRFEGECLKAGSYGGKWTNESCEEQFGKGSVPGVLTGAGAPRWKQRAFYDFAKDASLLVIGVPVARISVWDRLEIEDSIYSLGDILDDVNEAAAKPIYELIKSRV